jgi:hypothetical protein
VVSSSVGFVSGSFPAAPNNIRIADSSGFPAPRHDATSTTEPGSNDRIVSFWPSGSVISISDVLSFELGFVSFLLTESPSQFE